MPVETAADLAGFFEPGEFGTAASYEPAGGLPPLACVVTLSRPDERSEFGPAGVRVPAVIADVRASEVADPREGDTLVAGSVVYRVVAASYADTERSIWRLELVEEAS
jgi:hypothetical protein